MIKKSILIIEDDKNIAAAERLILEDDYLIHHAYDGKDGLKKAESLKPDLVILDLMLPHRGGYDLCFHIRQNKDLKHTKIIMVTAKNQTIDENKGILVGADEYVTKPFEPDHLLSVVKNIMK